MRVRENRKTEDSSVQDSTLGTGIRPKGSRLALFNSRHLDRLETIYPYDATRTMGRFFRKFGPGMYMCYGETDDLGAVRERIKSLAAEDWTGSDENDDGLFVHPQALGGVMLGVSRTTHAWTWSGYPDRRKPLPGKA